MTARIHRGMSAVEAVIAGWLGLSIPLLGKPRRRPHRKTDQLRASATVSRLLRSLEAKGCAPRRVAELQWFAWCPVCKAAGREALIEIRQADDGMPVVACVQGHEDKRRLVA